MQKNAGDLGEEVVMREIEKLKLPHKFYVFHNISLYSEVNFQMDILIITPFYALILEVKNISGEIEISTNPAELVRTKPNGEKNSFNSPVPQLEEYIYQLSQLFRSNKLNIPIYGAITFAFASSYVKKAPSNSVFLLTNEVRKFIREIKTDKRILADNELDKLKNWLLQKNNEYNSLPLSNHFAINPQDIVTGVECPFCGYLGMKKVIRNWACPRCRNFSKYAHEQTLKDYFLIYKNTINNEECRRFFHLQDKHEATRILKNPKLIKTGIARSTKYTMTLQK
ncbi:nuclease-related domain-containing protein [Psychrobacillus sp. OK032]|uniref:nuclease-related domain-containing protein n=1 Tax=Psychrobacillus sp. OK032 TaxID=1884358 RepID=UPI0015A6C586|nr:nuclease-related domain-containing protein [Psychrobacillus sp. OK032]